MRVREGLTIREVLTRRHQGRDPRPQKCRVLRHFRDCKKAGKPAFDVRCTAVSSQRTTSMAANFRAFASASPPRDRYRRMVFRPINWATFPPGGGDGGFSVSIRSALRYWYCLRVCRAQAPVFTSQAIRGKTGPAPSGAVLFGPFSYANKKKDEEKKKGEGRVDACIPPERSSRMDCPPIGDLSGRYA